MSRSSWRARRAASGRGERDEANESMLFLGDCLTSVREGFHGAGSSIIFGGRCVASYEASMQYVHEQAMAVRALRVPQCGDWCGRRELGPRQWCARAACNPWLTLAAFFQTIYTTGTDPISFSLYLFDRATDDVITVPAKHGGDLLSHSLIHFLPPRKQFTDEPEWLQPIVVRTGERRPFCQVYPHLCPKK